MKFDQDDVDPRYNSNAGKNRNIVIFLLILALIFISCVTIALLGVNIYGDYYLIKNYINQNYVDKQNSVHDDKSNTNNKEVSVDSIVTTILLGWLAAIVCCVVSLPFSLAPLIIILITRHVEPRKEVGFTLLGDTTIN
jgi:ABC-type Fe3+ transport system permease subunit